MVECSTRDGRLDLLIGDTPILDYYRANDPGCTLRTVDVIEEDNYAVGMAKGLRLQVPSDKKIPSSIIDLTEFIASYSLNESE